MTRPRPSRKARWTIGLSLTTLFAAVAFTATLTALVQGVGDLPAADPQSAVYPAPLDRSTLATVLDVDFFNVEDEPILNEDDGAYQYAMLDIRFQVWDDYLSLQRMDVATIEWDSSDPIPDVGDEISLRYRSADPEYLPQLGVGTQFVPDPAAPPFPTADSVNGGGPISPALRWTIAGSWLLTLVTLICTVLWARRARPAETAPAVRGQQDWGQPSWGQQGWGQQNWGQPSWGQPGWPPTDRVDLGGAPGWSPQGQYPQPQYGQQSDQQPQYRGPAEQPHSGRLDPSASSELPASPAPGAAVPSDHTPSTRPPAGLVPPG